MFSRDHANGVSPNGDHLGLTGDGRILFRHGKDIIIGKAMSYKRWQWMQVTLVRKGRNVLAFANWENVLVAELDEPKFPEGFGELFIGGRSDNTDNWEGRLDEVVIYDRALDNEELVGKVLRK